MSWMTDEIRPNAKQEAEANQQPALVNAISWNVYSDLFKARYTSR